MPFCASCGTKTTDNDAFCANCGNQLVQNSVQASKPTNVNSVKEKKRNKTFIAAAIIGLVGAVVIQTAIPYGFDLYIFIFSFIAFGLIALMIQSMQNELEKMTKGDKEK